MTQTGGANGGGNWVLRPKPNGRARVHVFCFPYAGIGPSAFRPWLNEQPSGIELRIVQLPGREARWREPAFKTIAAIVPPLTDALLPQLTGPFVFYGHSLGGLIAFEVTRELGRRGASTPLHLFVGAHRAPHVPNPHPPMRHLADDDFVDEIRRRYGGIPQAVLDNPELLELMLPCLRADFHAYETYEYSEEQPLPIGVSVFGGQQDEYVTQAQLEPWRDQTSGAFRLRMTPGGHFFLQTHRPAIFAAIEEDLQGVLNGPRLTVTS